MLSAHIIDPKNARDLSTEAIDCNGHIKVMPASFYANTTPAERGVLAVRHGVYCLPTFELVERLREIIDGRSAIEIGSGNGVLAGALDIHATDNKMQDDPEIREHYKMMGQPPVKYGANVEKITARDAVRKYRPRVVIAAWVTHLYDERNHDAGGNMFGVDELDILRNCEAYVFVGNTQVHAKKPLWKHSPDVLEMPSWIYSRALNGSPDFISVWSANNVIGVRPK